MKKTSALIVFFYTLFNQSVFCKTNIEKAHDVICKYMTDHNRVSPNDDKTCDDLIWHIGIISDDNDYISVKTNLSPYGDCSLNYEVNIKTSVVCEIYQCQITSYSGTHFVNGQCRSEYDTWPKSFEEGYESDE